MNHLSAIIICKNEADNIAACLESIDWVDEIILLDSGSEDDTLTIAAGYPVQIQVNRDWQGFGRQKNRALALASGEWVLSLDADERVTPALRDEILQVLGEADAADVYLIPRLSAYCGRWIRHSGWQPDHVARLFRRDQAHFSDDLVHERLLYPPERGRKLRSYLEHWSFTSMEQVLDKLNRYSTAGALRLRGQGKRASLKKAVFRAFWAFVRTYVLQRGFLDGREGFMLAVSNAEGVYYKYIKLLFLQENDT
jgi:glycosyltransferase involved in cell wall biosynthesis